MTPTRAPLPRRVRSRGAPLSPGALPAAPKYAAVVAFSFVAVGGGWPRTKWSRWAPEVAGLSSLRASPSRSAAKAAHLADLVLKMASVVPVALAA